MNRLSKAVTVSFILVLSIRVFGQSDSSASSNGQESVASLRQQLQQTQEQLSLRR